MATTKVPAFFACWVSNGEWEIRLDGPHQPSGERHIHIRRKRGSKGEYSWNADGSRHDKHRFPISEGMIGKAKEIAAEKLRVQVDSLAFLTGQPRGGYIVVVQEGRPWFSETFIFCETELIVLVSDDWLILVAPHLDDESQKTNDSV